MYLKANTTEKLKFSVLEGTGYEQKAVLVLPALLYLGVRNIRLVPALPAFLSPNVAKILTDNFGIAGIGAVDEDIRTFMDSEG